MALSFPNAQRVDGQRPIKGTLIVKDGRIGIAGLLGHRNDPTVGVVKLNPGVAVRVTSGTAKSPAKGRLSHLVSSLCW
jgi:hypothetical protein